MDKDIIYKAHISTPIGEMVACATSQGIGLLEFADRKNIDKELEDMARRLDAVIVSDENQYIELLREELGEYFHGKRRHFSVPLHLSGTEFQQAVWNILQEIPYGTTRSYMQQAKLLNNPKGVRAVAAANGMNQIAIVIPCHRVIGGNGSLTGYAGGLHRKKWLLDHERQYSGLPVQQELKF